MSDALLAMPFPTSTKIDYVCTHLPLSESQIRLSSPFSGDSLVFLQGAADDTRCDGEVAVVTILTISIPVARRKIYPVRRNL